MIRKTHAMLREMRSGVVLVWALVVVSIATTLVGSIGAYYIQGSKLAANYRLKTQARFKSLRFVDETKVAVLRALNRVLDKIRQDPHNRYDKSKVRQTLIEELKNKNNKNEEEEFQDGGSISTLYRIFKEKPSDSDEDAVRVDLNITENLEFEVTSNSLSGSLPGGMPANFYETFKLEGLSDFDYIIAENESKSHPIFNYVYFSNNYGHLESKGIVVNGDIGSNDKFTIDSAIVNGYVYAYSSTPNDASAVILRSTYENPRMWPYQTYLTQVAAEYKVDSKDYFTPVRPTDPFVVGGEMTPWYRGYQPPGSASGFGTAGGGIYTRPDNPWAGSVDPLKAFWNAMPKQSSYTWSGSTSTKKNSYNSYKNAINNWKNNYRAIVNSYSPAFPDMTARAYNNNKTASYSNFQRATYQSALDDYKNNPGRSSIYNNSDYKKMKDFDKEQGEIEDSVRDGSYEVPLTRSLVHVETDNEEHPIINVRNELVEMPNLSNDESYRQYCQNANITVDNINSEYSTAGTQTGGSISCPNRYAYSRREWVGGFFGHYETRTGEDDITWEYEYKDRYNDGGWHTSDNYGGTITRTLTAVNITGGYNASIMPFRTSSDESKYKFSNVANIEKGSVILIGTEKYPIIIKGPVYFDGDVLIRGFVSGQGAIYAGRNIHIIGDITYMNPPTWPNAKSVTAPVSTVEVAANNAKRDLLLLAARGNIVVGDYTDSNWLTSLNQWITYRWSGENTDSQISFDIDDSEIGYPTTLKGFARKYADMQAVGHRKMVSIGYSSTSYDSHWFNPYYRKEMQQSNELRFYQSKLGDDVINYLKQSDDADKGWSWSSRYIWRWILWYFGWSSTRPHRPGEMGSDGTMESGRDATDVTEIDAVMFANHGIFGQVGGSNSHKFTLNGAMACRDEGLLFSFRRRYSDAKIWLNWDMRIASDSAEGNSQVGAFPQEEEETLKVYKGSTSKDLNKSKVMLHTTDWAAR